ncbi:MAG: UbiX family flavin prenyltransferase [Rhodospirillales bacterium]
MKKLIIGITGSTGSILGIRLLEILSGSDIETHLIISKWGHQTLEHETSYTYDQVLAMADVSYGSGDMGAAVSSGSFRTEGMVIIPCSMASLAAVASGQGSHLVHRAADVILKERRKLVLVARELPLNNIHLENMLKLSQMGVSIVPPMMAFYNHPESIEDMVDHVVMRVLDQFDITVDTVPRWEGKMRQNQK